MGDPITGVLSHYDGATLLSITELPEAELIASGEFVLRYAIPYLEKPHLAIVPGLVAVDYGEMFNGEEMWHFILTKSNRYPRADVMGYRNDGVDEMIVLKRLDVDRPVQVLAYDSSAATSPIATIQALITSDALTLPARVRQYLPHYSSLAQWMQRE
jgi:hypothetical protein